MLTISTFCFSMERKLFPQRSHFTHGKSGVYNRSIVVWWLFAWFLKLYIWRGFKNVTHTVLYSNLLNKALQSLHQPYSFKWDNRELCQSLLLLLTYQCLSLHQGTEKPLRKKWIPILVHLSSLRFISIVAESYVLFNPVSFAGPAPLVVL